MKNAAIIVNINIIVAHANIVLICLELGTILAIILSFPHYVNLCNKKLCMEFEEFYGVCPYCGSENWEFMGEEYEPQPLHCHECDSWFGENEINKGETK